MSTFTLVHQIDIEAPADAAWAVVADYGRDTEWRTGVSAMVPTPAGLVTPETVTDEEMSLGGRTYRNLGRVLSVEPGRRFTWRTTDGAVAEGSRTVTATGPQRCTVTLELSVTAVGVNRLMAPVLRRLLARNQAADVASLRRLVECEAREGSQRRESAPASVSG